MKNNSSFCQKCGTAIEKSQKFCGNCGKPLPSVTEKTLRLTRPSLKEKFLAVAISIGFAVYLVNYYSSDSTLPAVKADSSSASNKKNPSIAPIPVERAIKVSADDYFLDYLANEIAADDKYKGKLVNIHGAVTLISKDAMGNPFIVLDTGGGNGVPIYDFPVEKARKLSIGSSVNVICRGNGMTLSIPTIKCK